MKSPNTHIAMNAEAFDSNNQNLAQNEIFSNQLPFGPLLKDMFSRVDAAPSEIIYDGDIHRFDIDATGDKKGWYVANQCDDLVYAAYGSWSEGETHRWNSVSGAAITPSQQALIKSAMSEACKKGDELRDAQRKKVAKSCQELWRALDEAPEDHPYLKAKGIKAHGIKLHPTDNGLIVPIYIDGEISSLQGIEETGKKNFRPGGRVSGGYFQIGHDGPLKLICEGYATGASLHEATGLPTIVAFNAGNLPKVAKRLKTDHPDTGFVVCADNDKWTKENPGLTKAKEAATFLSGIVAYPKFKKIHTDKHEKPTDWNDYHKLYGLNSVRSALKPKIKKAFRKRSLLTDFETLARDISSPDYLIQDMIETDTTGALIGPSATGKSLVCVDAAACVATGTPFAGKAVQQGAVVYMAGEGLQGIARRFLGWTQRTGIRIPKGNLLISNSAITIDADGALKLLDAVEILDAEIKLVVIDTLARHMSGEENSNRDMSAFIAAVDTIREEYGCSILIVHHTGHSHENSGRARGASAFYAALDFEFLIQGNRKGLSSMLGTKNKEGPLYPKRAFKLSPIELDGLKNADGSAVTTAVVDWGEFFEEHSETGRSSGHGKAFQALKRALAECGDFTEISQEKWREHVYQHSDCTNSDSKRSEFNRFKKTLIRAGVIEEAGGNFRVLEAELLNLGQPDDSSDDGSENELD